MLTLAGDVNWAVEVMVASPTSPVTSTIVEAGAAEVEVVTRPTVLVVVW